MTEAEATAIFHALASEHRRRMMDLLKARPGLAVGELAGEFDVSRIAVMNHLRVLEHAGLVISQQDGRTRRLYLNAAPIQMIHARWSSEYAAQWAERLSAVKLLAEAAARGARPPMASVARISDKGRGKRNGKG
jgi:DNA-binding transcriptional ArsR family regulator